MEQRTNGPLTLTFDLDVFHHNYHNQLSFLRKFFSLIKSWCILTHLAIIFKPFNYIVWWSKHCLSCFCFHVSLRATSQSRDGIGDPAVWEDQGCERGAAGASHSDLPGTGCECPNTLDWGGETQINTQQTVYSLSSSWWSKLLPNFYSQILPQGMGV